MRAMESIQALWRDASPLKRALLVAAPVGIATLAAVGITLAAVSGGDAGTDAQAVAESPTSEATSTVAGTPTLSVDEVLRYFAAVLPTATPVPPPPSSGGGGGGGGGGGAPVRAYVPQPALSGPGPIVGTDISLVIPKLGMNTNVNSRTIGQNGQMGDPSGAWMVLWYDFSAWPGLGGYPGTGNSNAVFAGHVDYIRVGPAVFYGIKSLVPGDQVTVNSANGPVTYAIQWSQNAGPNQDFTPFVQQTGQDVITLVTCIGAFSGGHYSSRLVVRGVRI